MANDPVKASTPSPAHVLNPTYAFDGSRLLVADGKDACLWDTQTGKELQRFRGHAEPVRAVAFSPDGKHAITGGGRQDDLGSFSTDNSARVWDLGTGKQVMQFKGHKALVHSVMYSPDGKRVLTAGADSTARLWDATTGKELFVLPKVHSGHPAVAISPDGGSILGLIAGGHVRVWDAQTGKELFQIESGKKGGIDSAVFDPAGDRILTASSDRTARTWDAKTGKELKVFNGHTSYVHDAVFTGDGKKVVTASDDGTVRMWDAGTGEEVRRIEYPGAVKKVLPSADGKRVFAKWRSAKDRDDVGLTLSVVETGEEVMQLPEVNSAFSAIVAFSPDGKRFLEVKAHKPVAIWDAETGKVITRHNK